MSSDSGTVTSQVVQDQQQLSRPPPAHVTGDSEVFEQDDSLDEVSVQEEPPAEVQNNESSLRDLLMTPPKLDAKPGPVWELYESALESTRVNRAPKRKIDGPSGYNRSFFEVIKERPSSQPSEELPELTPAPETVRKVSLECNFCYKPYKTSKTLGKHQRECVNNPNRAIFECQICLKTFKPSSRTLHMKTHQK